MPSILPRSVHLRSGRWWTLGTVLAVATFFAALRSYAITLTDMMISPMLLSPGIGTALLCDRAIRSGQGSSRVI